MFIKRFYSESKRSIWLEALQELSPSAFCPMLGYILPFLNISSPNFPSETEESS
jgi:hypothetical protein